MRRFSDVPEHARVPLLCDLLNSWAHLWSEFFYFRICTAHLGDYRQAIAAMPLLKNAEEILRAPVNAAALFRPCPAAGTASESAGGGGVEPAPPPPRWSSPCSATAPATPPWHAAHLSACQARTTAE